MLGVLPSRVKLEIFGTAFEMGNVLSVEEQNAIWVLILDTLAKINKLAGANSLSISLKKVVPKPIYPEFIEGEGGPEFTERTIYSKYETYRRKYLIICYIGSLNYPLS